MNIVIFACVRDEDNVINDWIDYNLSIGIEHIYN